MVIVNPNNKIAGEFSGIEPPLWAGVISSYTGNDILDAEALGLTVEETVEAIGNQDVLIVVMGNNPSASSTPKMTIAEELINRLPKDKVTLTGLHPIVMADQVENELGVKVSRKPFEGLPLIAWERLPMDKYRTHNWHCLDGSDRSPYASIYTSMGCPFNCYFCNIHTLYNNRAINYREIRDVMFDIELLVEKYGVRNIKIWDEMFALDTDRVVSLCNEISDRHYDLNMWAYARVNTVNQRMLDSMKSAGINWVGYGFESANDSTLKEINKQSNREQAIEAVRMTHDAGIHINGNFIFGLPNDSAETMRDTLDFAKELRLEYVNFYVAMPYPGSQWYEDAVKKGLKLPDTWDGYSQFSKKTQPLPTKYLSSREIVEFRDKAFTEFFNDSAYLERISNKFGRQAVAHINQMLTQDVRRN